MPAEGYEHAERVIVKRVHSVRPEVQQGPRSAAVREFDAKHRDLVGASLA